MSDEVRIPSQEELDNIMKYLQGDNGTEYKKSVPENINNIMSLYELFNLCKTTKNQRKRRTYASMFLRNVKDNCKDAGLNPEDVVYVARNAVKEILRYNREPDFTSEEVKQFWKESAMEYTEKDILEKFDELDKENFISQFQ